MTDERHDPPSAAATKAMHLRTPRTVLLENPTEAELRDIQTRFGVHPLIMDDLRAGRRQPKFERLGSHMYLTIWDLERREGSVVVDTELVMVFNDSELVLVQRGPDGGLRDVDALVRQEGPVPAPPVISAVYRILDAVVSDFVSLGGDVEQQLEEVEAEVFDSRVREDYQRIYRLRQLIGRIDRAASGLAEVLRSARHEIDVAIVSAPALRPYFVHLENNADGASELTAAEHGALDAVVSSHESNVATRQNQDMRTISAFAALLAIPTVIAGIYGMNFHNLPLLQGEFGWLVVAIAMVVLDIAAYALFRHRGWVGGGPRSHDD